MPNPELKELLKDRDYQLKNNIDTNDPTGFQNATDSTFTVNPVNRTVTIQPVTTEYKIKQAGATIIKTSAESVVWDNTSSWKYVYFDTGGNIQAANAVYADLIKGSEVLITIFYWNAVTQEILFGDEQEERHGCQQDGQTHYQTHYDVGLSIFNIGDAGLLKDITADGDGSSDTHFQFATTQTHYHDEDLAFVSLEKTKTHNYKCAYIGAGELLYNATTVSNSGLIVGGNGRLMYNKHDGVNSYLIEADSGKYVNYYVILRTGVNNDNRVVTIPGNAQYDDKSALLASQIDEALTIKFNLNLPEFKIIGVIGLKTDDSYTNAAKSIIVSGIGNVPYTDLRDKNIGNGSHMPNLGVIPNNLVRKTIADTYCKDTDMAVHGANTGDAVVWFDDISTRKRFDREWTIATINNGGSRLLLRLVNDNDSIYGTNTHTAALTRQGQAVKIGITEDKKYVFTSGIQDLSELVIYPTISTLQGDITATTLTMNGSLDDMAGEDKTPDFVNNGTIDVGFRYREIGDLTWIETTKIAKGATGVYQQTATVTGSVDYEIQALCEDTHGRIGYGSVINTQSNYYPDASTAQSDGLLRYWDLQEDTGTDTVGTEKLGSGDDIVFQGGVTIASNVINGNTIYKRIFIGNAWGESPFKIDNNWTGTSITIMMQINMASTSSDHTIFSGGRNILSIASDNTSIQTQVSGSIKSWSNATPTGDMTIFVTMDRNAWETILNTVTPTIVTQRAQKWDIPDAVFQYFRIANGTSGDSNHQAGEYANNMTLKNIAVWQRILSDNQMKDIVSTLETKGMLIV